MLLVALAVSLLAAPTGVLLKRFGVECHTELSDDSVFAKCDDMCADDAQHCALCRCRACATCAALPADGSDGSVAAPDAMAAPTKAAPYHVTAAMVAAAVVPTPSPTDCSGPTEMTCEEFCSPFKGQHCSSCRCAQ